MMDNPPNKNWDLMTRDEKLRVYDAFELDLKQLATKLESELNDILIEGKCTMRVEAKIYLVINPNDDPRLPDATR